MRHRRKLILIVVCLIIPVVNFFNCMEPGQAYLSVNASKCKSCSVCIGVCPADAVRIINGKAVIDPSKCTECGKCVEVCPVNAIY
jgi:ferredoxin